MTSPSPDEGTEDDSTMTSPNVGSEKQEIQAPEMTSPNGVSEKQVLSPTRRPPRSPGRKKAPPMSRTFSFDLLTINEEEVASVGKRLEDYSGRSSEEEEREGIVEQQPRKETMMEEGWKRLKEVEVTYEGVAVGTLAANDTSKEPLNYDQVFVRDFVPVGIAYLMKDPPEPNIVKEFLLSTLRLQGGEKKIDDFTMGEGVMPASFKIEKPGVMPASFKIEKPQDENKEEGKQQKEVLIADFGDTAIGRVAPVDSKDKEESKQQREVLTADFGGTAIGRVAPVDSGFWWIILLHAYKKCNVDSTFTDRAEVQRGMKLILNLCLADGFDTFPTLLCADGCSMIDRRMGVYGYPIEIQALFYFALRCAKDMLNGNSNDPLLVHINKRINALTFHLRKYYWLDFKQLNNIYRYKTEEYSHTAVNKFNVMPDTIPESLFKFMPLEGGFFVGNVSPARMDFRWFLVGNCIAIMSSLATNDQAMRIMDLIEERWDELIGEMPLKVVYPALKDEDWKIVIGYDRKNTCWSYHNGGSWPVLIWLLTAACIKTERPEIAKKAIELLEPRLKDDDWPEYYDGEDGRYIGKQARKFQTWSISSYLAAKLMMENPSNLEMVTLQDDIEEIKEVIHGRTNSMPDLQLYGVDKKG